MDTREAFALYGVIVGFLFLFFVLGLLIGRQHSAQAKTGNLPLPAGPGSPVQDVKPQLEFYDSLMSPSQPPPPAVNRPLPERFPAEAPPEQTATSGLYTVQVGALTEEADARRLLLRLEARGYAAVLRGPSAEDAYYRIWVGRFKTAEAALGMERRLRVDGFLTYLKKTN